MFSIRSEIPLIIRSTMMGAVKAAVNGFVTLQPTTLHEIRRGKNPRTEYKINSSGLISVPP